MLGGVIAREASLCGFPVGTLMLAVKKSAGKTATTAPPMPGTNALEIAVTLCDSCPRYARRATMARQCRQCSPQRLAKPLSQRQIDSDTLTPSNAQAQEVSRSFLTCVP